MRNALKQLARDSAVYGAGNAAAKVLSFVLVPVFIRFLSVYDYGIIEMLGTVTMFVGIIGKMGLVSAQSYYFFTLEDDRERQRELVSSISQLRVVICIGILVVMVIVFPVINRIFFDGKMSLMLLLLVTAGAMLLMFQEQYLEILRYTHQAFRYIGVKITNDVLFSGIGIVLVGVFHMGVLGYYTGYCSAAFVAFILTLFFVRNYLKVRKIYRVWWPKLLRFGIPLIPMSLSIMLMSITDKWCIKYFLGLDAVGIYSVGNRFAFVLLFYAIVFRTAWWPIAMKNLENRPIFSRISRAYLGGGLICTVIVSLCAPLLSYIVPGGYAESHTVIGILGLNFVFYGFLQISQLGIFKSENTGILSLVVFISALVNLLLNMILIPLWGIVGAASATMLSMVIRNGVSLFISEKRWNLGLPVPVYILQFLLALIPVGALVIWRRSIPVLAASTIAVILLLLTSFSRRDIGYLLKKLYFSGGRI